MKKLLIIVIALAGCTTQKDCLIGVTYEDYPSTSRKWIVTDWCQCIENGISSERCTKEYWEVVTPNTIPVPPKKVARKIK